MADQPTNRERVKEIVAGIEQNIQELFQSERYFDYLRTMSQFHNYSVNNTLLIHMQRPHAANPVAGFRKWKQFGRHVKKGEKGLTIIAPTPLKKKIEETRLDPETNAPALDPDGNVIIDEKIIEIPLFKPVKVFSADQTEGRPLPSLSADLTGDVQQYEAFMEALRRTSPMPISFGALDQDTDGLCNYANHTITIREGMSQVQTVCAAVHEIGHAVLHNREKDRLSTLAGNTENAPPQAKDENTMEVEAESVSYAVCRYYGIDTSANSTGYIAAWSKDRSLPELKASLETITKTVNALITSIDKHFAEICKERGIDLAAPEQSAPMEPDTPEKFVADFFAHLDELCAAELIPAPYPPDQRDNFENIFLNYLREGNFGSFRYVLADAEKRANMPATAALHDRLEKLSDQWDAALICKIEPEFDAEAAQSHSMLRTYEQRDGQLIPGRVVFTGSLDECQRTMAGLEAGTITLRDVRASDFEPPPAPEPVQAIPPETGDTTLDEYPLPDSAMTLDDLAGLGYAGTDLLPLSRDRGAELADRDMTVYMVRSGEEPEMVFDREDLMEQPEDVIFAIPREEWEASQEFQQAVADRMDRQKDREQAFLEHCGDCFAIYQLRDDDALRDIRFESIDWLKSMGRTVERGSYDLVYTSPLPETDSGDAALDRLWGQFNNDHPPDYRHPSMSVSDIIAVKRDGVVSFHYCDSFGFRHLPDFIQPENGLKNAEMQMEDDYNMLDGIINNGPKATVAELEQQARSGQPISLMDLAEAVHREEKKSVVARLKGQPPQARRKPTLKKDAEIGR